MIETIGGSGGVQHSSSNAGSRNVSQTYQPATRNVQGYEEYRSPVHFHSRTSPVPEYTQFDNSTRLSDVSPPLPAASYVEPSNSLGLAFTKSTALSPSVLYSEIHSPDPEVVHHQEEKQVYNWDEKHLSGEYADPVPGIRHTSSGDRPQVFSGRHTRSQRKSRKPWYKRWIIVLLILIVLTIIAIAIALGIYFGRRHSSTNNNSALNSKDPETNVGGYLSSQYYSTSGAFNGSGIAIAAAKPGVDTSIYAFYQDHTGELSYSLMNPQNQWNVVGPINSGSYKAMNGTPLSTVQHQLGNQSIWHLFYIDENYYMRERIITNDTTDSPTPIWRDGPLSGMNLRTWHANTIGMQACYWGDYYGRYSIDNQTRTTGMHLWYADTATTFQQYSWSNGTSQWQYDRAWTDVDGNAGVACQTWDSGTTEYVWFVDTKQNIAMYWKDSNETAAATASHPLGVWTPVNINIGGVQKASSMGYTNYAIYQHQDGTIRGADILFAAENTTIRSWSPNVPDTFVLQTNSKDIHALRATHMSITGTKTVSNGQSLLVFFQEAGNDMRMYTRDAVNTGGVWQAGGQDPVSPG